LTHLFNFNTIEWVAASSLVAIEPLQVIMSPYKAVIAPSWVVALPSVVVKLPWVVTSSLVVASS